MKRKSVPVLVGVAVASATLLTATTGVASAVFGGPSGAAPAEIGLVSGRTGVACWGDPSTGPAANASPSALPIGDTQGRDAAHAGKAVRDHTARVSWGAAAHDRAARRDHLVPSGGAATSGCRPGAPTASPGSSAPVPVDLPASPAPASPAPFSPPPTTPAPVSPPPVSSPPATPAPVNPAPVATAPTGTAPTHFSTLAPTATLPSGAQCAAWVRAIPIAEKRSDNAAKNNRTGRALTGAGGLTSKVTGNFTGTTEQILRWGACKWGIDEDIVKAQAVKESYWHMSTLGDWGTTASRCSPAHPLGADGKAGQCPESIGIMQVRYAYHSVSFPEADTSTAENVDYAYAQWRACYTGLDTWMSNGYAAGDAWGCVGAWFSGNFHDSAANGYITMVKDIVSARTWEGKYF